VVVSPKIDSGVHVTGATEYDLVDYGTRKLADPIQEVELVEDGNRLTGEGVPADFVAGKPLFVQEEDSQPVAAGEEGSRRACRAAAYDDEIVHLLVGVAHVIGTHRSKEKGDSKLISN
jgi:hypothetical protein